MAPEPRFDESEKLSVVAVTVRFTVVVFDTPDWVSVACTVTGVFETTAMFAAVLITSVLEVEFSVVKVQFAPAG